MTLEIGFVDRDVLDRDQGVVVEFDHAVDHHERIAMGQGVEDLADVQGRAGGGRRGFDLRAGGSGFGLGGLGFLPLLADGCGEAGVERVARADGDDVGLEANACEDDVADDIEDLVADELVLEAQRLLADNLVALEDDRGVERATLDEALLDEAFDVFVDRERAGRSDLRFVGLGIDVDCQVLRVDAAIIGRGARDAKAVERQGDDGATAFVDRDRVRERERLALGVLFDDSALVDERREGASRAIDDWRFGGVDLDDGVVHGHAAEGREYVLDGVQLDGVGRDGRLTLQFGDHLGHRADLRLAEEVDTTEDQAGVGGTRFKGQGDFLTSVESLALYGGFFAKGALFHAVHTVIHTPLPL